MERELNRPWLVAAWPGMGNVAIGAAAYLVESLGAVRLAELPPGDYFDLKRIEVKGGIVQSARLPRSTFYGWRDPRGRRDLVVFVGEAQPSERGYEFCSQLMGMAAEYGIERVFTFAAMATPIHPSAEPRVFAVATHPRLLDEVRRERVHVLNEGEITGLNGVLLASALERGVGGVCLLGELPFFAIGVPNPKASLAVLRVFQSLAGLSLELREMEQQAAAVERGLLSLLERMNRAAQARAAGEEEEAGFSVPGFAAGAEEEEQSAESEPAEQPQPQLDARARRRIEQLFERARQDRTKALELKHELDRLGVFKQYEDRFLDLFKTGE
ncbi:MAG: hypothetical protein KatS3mg102_2555 [Planctomycetota bacterium]|nr:MAG: hypothetical protein KatS3mg102_2555 [Planctomycetota bacterium]